MTMPTNGGQTGGPAGGQAAPAQLNVLAQYVKDLSFENPNAPRSLQPAQQQPNINIRSTSAPSRWPRTTSRWS